MNLKEIVKNIRSDAKTLSSGPDELKSLGQRLSNVADQIEQYEKARQRPIAAETLKQVRVSAPKFKPRRLS